MATPAKPAGQPANAGNAGTQQQAEGGGWWSVLQRMLLFYAISQVALRFFAPSKPDVQPPSPAEAVTYNPETMQPAAGEPNPWSIDPLTITPAWELGTKIAVHVVLSQSYGYDLFSKSERSTNGHLPHVTWSNLTWGSWDWKESANYTVDVPTAVQNNGSLFAHIYITKEGSSPDHHSKTYDPQSVSHLIKPLSRFQPQLKVRKEKSLLSSKDEPDAVEVPEEADVIASYWYPELNLAVVSDAGHMPFPNMAPAVRQFVNVVPGKRDTTGKQGFYYPVIFPNDFWILKSHMTAINSTTPTLPLTISLTPMSFMKFQIYATMTQGFEDAGKQQGGAAASELDEVKRMLTETNPYFLALTGIVSILHTVFEMLAFKNDVQHWRTRKELVGVSIRTIITNVVIQLIILLYLVDNNDNTSWMILFGQGTGMLIEAWKITKAVDISLQPAPPGLVIPYRVQVKDKHVLSEDEKKTQVYDALAFRYVSYVAIPLLFGYSIYSLLYNTHRGWYSFVISTMTSFVYMFGFAQLVPQLIINYKLKSVSHMPFKAMIYKTLSTVVDDFFAFCIKMPWMHRLACFRDDVVFLIFLYQRHIYKIDHARLNEYGQVSEQAPAEKESKKNR